MTPEQQEWMSRQDTTSTGDAGRDRLIFRSIASRFFEAFPSARRVVCPDSLAWPDIGEPEAQQ